MTITETSEGVGTTAGLDESETYAFLRGNAVEAFGLERFGIAE